MDKHGWQPELRADSTGKGWALQKRPKALGQQGGGRVLQVELKECRQIFFSLHLTCSIRMVREF